VLRNHPSTRIKPYRVYALNVDVSGTTYGEFQLDSKLLEVVSLY
jgi:hypothetical protein